MSTVGELTNAGVNLGLGIGSLIAAKRNNKRTNETNLQIAKETNAINQANWQKEFDYQKYLNENQYQIQARDQAKAGINPIAANGGTLQAYSGNTNTASAAQMQQADYSRGFEMLANVFSEIRALKHDSQERKKDRENAKDIAEINAEASKHAAELSNEGTHYSTDTQAAIAAMNAKNQKEIAQLNTKTQKEIANANNELQKELQKNMQEWQDSDDHALAQQKIQRMLYNVQRDHELLQYAQNARVAIKTETGEVKNLTIEDALKYAEMCTKLYDNSTARRVFKNVLEGIRGFSDVTRGAR